MSRKDGTVIAPPATNALSRRDVLQGGAQIAVLAGLGSAVAAVPRFAHAADSGLVALVHTQAAGDNGPIDDMIANLKKLSGEKGFKIRTIYASDPATFESTLRTLGEAGAAVVVTTFLQMAEPIKAVAPSFPKTKFIQLYADPMKPDMPNVKTVEYLGYYGMYLSGVFAGKISKSGQIGYIGGASLPGLNADLNALKAGAAAVNPSAKVTGAFAGSFQDPAKGREIADQMFKGGADYIQCDAAATDAGVIQSANEGQGKVVSGVFRAQFKLGPKTVAASVLVDFGTSLYKQVSAALGADWKGGHYQSDLSDGIIDFIPSDEFMAQGPADIVAKAKAAWPDVEKAKKDIIAGSLKVPFKTTLD